MKNTKRTYFTLKDLISFGNYLLSETRSAWMDRNNEAQDKPYGADKEKVFNADVENWKQRTKR